MHKTVLRVLSVTISSSVVVPVVLHSYPLCQQPVCVCVCVCVCMGGRRGHPMIACNIPLLK